METPLKLKGVVRFCLLISLVFSPSAYADEDGRSDWILWENWLSDQQRSETGVSSDHFRNSHFMKDVAEDYWLKPNTSVAYPSSDVAVTAHQLRRIFAHQPWNVIQWLPLSLRYIHNMLERPFAAILEIESLFWMWMPPLVVSLFLVLLLHLWTWAAALVRDFPSWFKARSPWVIGLLEMACLLWAFHTSEWLIFLHLMLCFAVLYSRRPKVFVNFAIFNAFLLSFAPLISSLTSSAAKLSAYEGLMKGRTQVTYSQESLEALTALEKSIWADMNNDKLSAVHWLKELPSSRDRDILSLNYRLPDETVTAVLGDYELAYARWGDDPILLYNLAQLDVRAQNLVRAEELEQKIGPAQLKKLRQRAEFGNRLLLHPLPSTPSSRFFSQWGDELKAWCSEAGLSPFKPLGGAKALVFLFWPWLLLGFCWSGRKHASGICIHTGEPTASPETEVSALYQSLHSKTDTAPNLRQQVDQLFRMHLRRIRRRCSRWSFILPGASDMIFNHRWTLAFLKTFGLTTLFWFSLSWGMRENLLSLLGYSISLGVSTNTFSSIFLIAAMGLYIYFVIDNRKDIP